MVNPDPDGSVDWVRYRADDGDSYAVWAGPLVVTGGPKEVERTLKALIGQLWDAVGAIRVSEERRLHGATGFDPSPQLWLPGRPKSGKHHL